MTSNPSTTQNQSDTWIYVASLSDYNAGRLHGTWIDADQDPDDLHDAVKAMLNESPEPFAEEFAIHDREGFYGLIGEYSSLQEVSRIARAIAQHGKPFALYAQNVGVDHAIEYFEDAFCGICDSLEDWAMDLILELYQVPTQLLPYIDAQAFARDLELNGDYHFEPLDYDSYAVFSARY